MDFYLAYRQGRPFSSFSVKDTPGLQAAGFQIILFCISEEQWKVLFTVRGKVPEF